MSRLFSRRRLIAVFVIIFAIALAAVLWRVGSTWRVIPSPVPAATFTSIKGDKIALSSLKGRVVLVNFWAPSCAPCIHEMPMLADTYTRLHARGLDVIAVAASYDPPNIVVDYAETRHLPFPVALDIDDAVARSFGGLHAVPSTFVIGRNGQLAEYVEGALDPEALQQMLKRELAAN